MWLRVLTGPDAGKNAQVAGDTFVVGRRRGCELVLHDPEVADRHAAFRADGHGGYEIEDLGSQSGTFVAGRRIKGPVPLRGDEQLCFGDTFVRLSRVTPRARRRRRTTVVAAAVGAVVAAAGVTAGILAPKTGGGPAAAVHHAAAPAAPAAPALEPAAEPAAETVAGATTVEETGGEAAAPTEAAGNEPAERIVFREDFSDPGSGWEVFDVPTVTAGYEQGAYVIRITDATWYATVDSGLAARRPVVTLTVRNPGRTASAGFGVVCHYRSDTAFDVLAVGTDGTYAILRQRGESLTVLSGGGQWLYSPRIPVGAARYRLRADCRGEVLRLWVNGRRVGQARAQALDGRVGLFAAGLAELRFDDVTVEADAAA